MLLQILPDTDKLHVMNLMSSPSFNWTAAAIMSAPKYLKLDTGKNLAKMFKYIKAMQEAVKLGVAKKEDLVPDWSLDKLENIRLQEIRLKRHHVKSSDTDIGVSRHVDLASFSLIALPGETREDHFHRLCLARSRGGPLQLPVGVALEVTPQQKNLLQPTERQLSIGNLLRESNTHYGAKLGLRRLNLLGEVDGLCRHANDDTRLEKLKQALQVSATNEELTRRKQAVKKKNAQTKLVVAAAVAVRKRITESKRLVKQHTFEKLKLLLGSEPENIQKYSAAQLKTFVNDKLGHTHGHTGT